MKSDCKKSAQTCVCALRVSVTVAAAERSFSKIKLIKTHMSSTMSREHLSGPAEISISHHGAQNLDKMCWTISNNRVFAPFVDL